MGFNFIVKKLPEFLIDVLEDHRCKSRWNRLLSELLVYYFLFCFFFFNIIASLEINHLVEKLLVPFSRK